MLGAQPALSGRPGASLPPVDLETTRAALAEQLKEEASNFDLASHLMYPDLFRDYAEHEKEFGDVSILPTHVFSTAWTLARKPC